MKLFVTGPEHRYNELAKVLPPKAEVDYFLTTDKDLSEYDAVIDLSLDERPEKIEDYKGLEGIPVIGSAVKRQLAEIAVFGNNEIDCYLFGINALPSFLVRDIKEISVWNQEHKTFLNDLTEKLEWDYQIVEDRVGMASSRVIMMIINEACYTLQEGTANMEDIDLSLKKGVNYPEGPFEWADKIGVRDVYETLEAIYDDTKDERYKICPLLKTKYLKEEGFRVDG